MKCPECNSSNLLQLGVNSKGRSDLICLDCGWDNMSELPSRKPVIPGVYRFMGINLAGDGPAFTAGRYIGNDVLAGTLVPADDFVC